MNQLRRMTALHRMASARTCVHASRLGSARLSRTLIAVASSVVIAGAMFAPVAQAQLGDLMNKGKEAAGASGGSGAGGSGGAAGAAGSLGGALGGDASGALGSASTGNVTGLVQYCLKNQMLGGDASSVKDKLMGKLGGEQKAKQDSGYMDGAKGILSGGDGKKMDLSGGGLKEQATKKICEQVLSRGKSLI